MRPAPLFSCVACLLVACGGSSADAPASATDAASDAIASDTAEGADANVADAADASPLDAAADAPGDSPPGSCLADVSAGAHVYACDGIKYDVTIPPSCVSSRCGLVLDVHGFTMSGKMEDNNTNMRALGATYGYVVVQPNANPAPPSASWTPGTDDDKVFAFVKLAIGALKIDDKRVHMTGFSQGGMMSSRFLCKHADAFASIAPAAGTGCSFAGTDTPSVELPVLYLHGTKDALVSFSQGTAQRDALIAAWKMTGETVIASDATYKWTRWTNAAGTTFEFLQHDYTAATPILGGHCYPGSKDLKGGDPGQLFGFACTQTAAFTWGEAAMKFFVAHPKK